MIQLPDDVIAKGYVKKGRFEHEQVFYSPSKNFTGTEKQFVEAGHGYRYRQIDKHTRAIVKS